MIENKRINIVVAVVVIVAVIISVAMVVVGSIQQADGDNKSEPEYATKVFGSDIISIEIIVDEEDWQEMLDNAINEQYIAADVVVNGTNFQQVGIRPKGNSSLTQVANSDSDRYSFRLQFDEYISDQTCFGLESFVLNNMIGDNTYMKEYVSYEIMREIGVDAPYFGFADIKVNGESWGLYLAVELYNDSYEQRVFGDTSGMLYNVKSMDMDGNQPGQQGGGNPLAMPGGQNSPAMPDEQNASDTTDGQIPPAMPDRENIPTAPGGQKPPAMPKGQSAPTMSDGQNPPAMPGGQNRGEQNASPMANRLRVSSTTNEQDASTTPNAGNSPVMPDDSNISQDTNGKPAQRNGETSKRNRNFASRGRGSSSGGSLEYIDDNVESYGAIFNNVVGKGGTEEDYQRVIRAIKALNEGEDLEKYFDVDKILRYLAAHTFVVNLDSYSSNMAQNYYIYERDGQLTILPWDYNLAWGGFQSSSATSVINFPIDTPVSGVEMSSRPLIDKLLSNEEYLERYHSYLQQIIDNYFADGKFTEKINALDVLISDYVKNDITAFCTYEEYKTAVSSFITLGNLRAQSVQGQLDGTVPSTREGQNANPDMLISAGDLKLSDLGSNMMGGGRGGNDGGFPGRMGGQDGNRNPQNGDMRRFPDNMNMDNNMRGMGQGEQARNFPAFAHASPKAEFNMGTGNLIVIGALILVLIAALIFAARFKRNY